MTRQFTTLAVAVACACTLGLRANAQTEKTKVEAEHGKTVTFTGCVQSGTETNTYVLAHAIPMTEKETRGTTGATDETSYLLVPDKTITMHEQIGQRARVTGVLIKPGHGDAKIETRTKENGETTNKTKEEVKRGPMPQFRVVSIKPLGERCQ
jgi:hypothetical protein